VVLEKLVIRCPVEVRVSWGRGRIGEGERREEREREREDRRERERLVHEDTVKNGCQFCY
jgi:hypothetical protein